MATTGLMSTVTGERPGGRSNVKPPFSKTLCSTLCTTLECSMKRKASLSRGADWERLPTIGELPEQSQELYAEGDLVKSQLYPLPPPSQVTIARPPEPWPRCWLVLALSPPVCQWPLLLKSRGHTVPLCTSFPLSLKCSEDLTPS